MIASGLFQVGYTNASSLEPRHSGQHHLSKLLAIFTVRLVSRTVVAAGVICLRAFESLTNRRMKHSAIDNLVERFDWRTGLGR
jgi:hypothetical protein